MNMHPGRAHHEPPAALDSRVLVLEDRVTALEEALRVLAHGLEDLPAAEPTACCWWPGRQASSQPPPSHPLPTSPRPGAPEAKVPSALLSNRTCHVDASRDN
jgi:hypothetical protein